MNTKESEERKKDADDQPATTTSPIYPITQSVSTDILAHITGPNISLWQWTLCKASLSLYPSPLLSLSLNPNSFIFPSDKDLVDLTSGLTDDISKQLLKWKQALWDEGKGPGLHNLSISALGYK